ncbi:FUSC family protein [Stigmatella sp. ncwal1]|uniref:FUSC family protein n=1 Tax=Stigmatella ashevillensis TaxID=2995309 RepID=A0ABT5CZP1_9BACT|nr:FUSC family protein [Stigmatella ashevillena]MDC0706900.1 FUSC family protein [Stigmatella ashevillena]
MRAFRLSHGWDCFVTSDPDLSRLKMGLRALLGMGLTLGALTVLGPLVHQPTSLGMVGMMVGMMTSVSVQDPLPRQERITLLCVPGIAAAAVCLGAISASNLVVSSLLFLGVTFLAVSARRFGPRGTALGTIAFMTFFFALFVHASAAQLPWMLASVGVGSAVAYGIRTWLVPERSLASLRRTLHVYRRSISLLLAELAQVLASPEGRRREKRIRRAFRRVNEGAMEVEQHLERVPPEHLAPGLSKEEIREHLLALELAAERLASTVYQGLSQNGLTPSERQTLQAHVVRLGRESRGLHSPPQGSPLPSVAHQDPSTTAVKIEGALNKLREVMARPFMQHSGTPRSLATDVAVPSQEEAAPEPKRLHASTRQAIQATVAGGLAMVAGHALSSTRWYWAVVASFVVFNRASTRGDILLRAWHRALGTVVGVMAGLILATVVSGHRDIEIALLFVCAFLGFYLLRVSYAWMVFWFTTLLVVLYSLTGRYSPDLLYLRLWETLAGAGIGALVAVVLLPSRTRVRVWQTSADVLRSVASSLDGVAAPPSPTNSRLIVERVRKIDTQLREVRESARPLIDRMFFVGQDTRRLVHALASIAFFVRHLEPLGASSPAEEDALRSTAADLAEKARLLASMLEEGDSALSPEPGGAPLRRLEDKPPAHSGHARIQPPLSLWLERIDAALMELHDLVRGLHGQRGSPTAQATSLPSR